MPNPSTNNKVIFIGAHPDDIELGCGATVLRFVEANFDVHCYFLTHGEKAGDPSIRENESRKALTKALGVVENNIHFPEKNIFSDTAIPFGHQTIEFLENTYLNHEKDSRNIIEETYAIFTHSVHDNHQDHQTIAKCSIPAFRRCRRIYSYETPSSTNEFHPNITMGFDEQSLLKKSIAIQYHKSQIKLNRWYMNYEAMMGIASFRGRFSIYKYVEAFEVIRDEFNHMF